MGREDADGGKWKKAKKKVGSVGIIKVRGRAPGRLAREAAARLVASQGIMGLHALPILTCILKVSLTQETIESKYTHVKVREISER